MTKREQKIHEAKVAGYHNDSASFTRLLIEALVNRDVMKDAWSVGVKLKKAGVPCHCNECKAA